MSAWLSTLAVALLIGAAQEDRPSGEPPDTSAAAVFETDALRLEIGPDGLVRRLVAKPAGVEYAVATPPCPVAVAYRGGRMAPTVEGEFGAATKRWVYQGGTPLPATRVVLAGDQLTVEFGSAGVKAAYRVRSTDDYLAFELLGVDGEAIDRIEFLRLAVRRLPRVGQWLGAVYDDRFGVCLCGGSLQTNMETLPEAERVLLTAAAEAAVGFRGATAVLFGCREPRTAMLDVLAKVERDFRLPAGADFRRLPLQKLSYFWATQPTPQNIDQYIHWAKRGGFRVLLLSYTAFSKSPGHFPWNAHYPNGMADLKRVTDAIRAAGLHAGLHIHYSKTRKGGRYTTPVPDGRLHKLRRFTLAAPLDGATDTLTVREDPSGSTLDKGRRILMVGQELIAYQNYTTRPPYQFTGCERGHLLTTATVHPAGAEVGLLNVDSWDVFIRFDQNTDIQDEVARRIADIYRQTGPYAMVYFDGAEDVHAPFWYHVAAAQYRVFRLLEPPPPVCESAHYTHFSWHMISRSNAYDVVASPDGMKDFCRLMPCPTAAVRELDFSRVQFGWLGRLGRREGGYAGPDVFEYVASRAAAWDCPLSLHARLEELAVNPRAEDCLAAIKIWEDARVGNHLSDEDRRLLRNVAPEDAHYVPCYDQRQTYENWRQNRDLSETQRRILADRREHHLFLDEQGRYELVEIEELPGVAQGAVKAFLFRRAAHPEDAYVLIWTVEGQLRLRFPDARLAAMRPFGTPLTCVRGDGGVEVPVGARTYLVLRNADRASARQVVRLAQVVR
ncbi:MAG: hypothetical protein GX575_23490 [Candidatus Anammoximicrobium sp.]|nr:hypothetical protein [Candidatus Anammoximicrobium sp.]